MKALAYLITLATQNSFPSKLCSSLLLMVDFLIHLVISAFTSANFSGGTDICMVILLNWTPK